MVAGEVGQVGDKCVVRQRKTSFWAISGAFLRAVYPPSHAPCAMLCRVPVLCCRTLIGALQSMTDARLQGGSCTGPDTNTAAPPPGWTVEQSNAGLEVFSAWA